MAKPDVEELLRLAIFDGESREAVEWMASQMEVRRYESGQEIFHEGGESNEFVIILEGEMHLRPTGYDSILIAPAGQATGMLPFSRMKTWGANGWAAQPTRIAAMPSSHHRELIYRAPVLAQRLVNEMTDRARMFTRMEEGSNRLLALGKLAAGLAHELNNPASAAVRSSARMRELLAERRRHVLFMRTQSLSPRAVEIMNEISDSLTGCDSTPGDMSALDRSDREADLAEWLESHGVTGELAAGLVDARLGIDRISPLVPLVSSEILTHGLHVLAADYEVHCLIRELEEASRRISDLVQAVKSYSYMDQSPIAQVDIEKGIDVTLRMFQHQLKQGIEVKRDFASNLPRVRANGSELNQVWTNLIDNSLDALESVPKDQPRILTVCAHTEHGGIVVEIGDNGPGIPPDVQNRIFEPFFTTKDVGEGTGLGLDIVQRIVRKHKGSIRVDSKPGRTVFQVRLPV